jgi:hypothetical protein
MSTSTLAVKQKLLLQIEALSEYELQDVLDYVKSVLTKGAFGAKEIKHLSQPEILEALTDIRETVRQTSGIYQRDLVAEARAERHLPLDCS